jgi:4-alpha-glucanotransferase
MKFERSSGILLHPTSLPGKYGIGDIGPQAYRWVDFLAEAKCKLWQILPLGPTGYGDSPYQCFSAFAGNPNLISPELLLEEGLLKSEDLDDLPMFPMGRVDYGTIIPWKITILDRAYQLYQTNANKELKDAFSDFHANSTEWLNDYCLFMALKDAHNGAPWSTWETPLRKREPKAIEKAHRHYQETISRHVFRQFIFFRQWKKLRAYVQKKHIQIIGDIPIFVAHDSADVWANPDLFFLNRKSYPSVVAGVPPDYFSATGQLWGNPLYRWERHANTGFTWWIRRIRSVFDLVDIIRLDHFRGFVDYWEVPANENTAIKGHWVPGPGIKFFNALRDNLGDLPLIAEDLGAINPAVYRLRQQLGLPGMKILVFAFDSGPINPFLPHNTTNDFVVYTGTHDNDTTRGWYDRVDEKERDFARRYLCCDGHDISWDLIRTAWASVGIFSIAPMQDLLSLGNEARMNYPSCPSGNWIWRMPSEALNDFVLQRLMEYNWVYGRANGE